MIQVHLPDSLQKQVQILADRDSISVDQFIATAVAEKMSAMMTESYLEERVKRGSREKYENALSQIPNVDPDDRDKIPNK